MSFFLRTHEHTHTHVDHVLFFKSFSLHTHTSTHTHQHTHQPDTQGLLGLLSFHETLTHETSFYLRTHEHTHTHTHVDRVLFLKSFSLHTPYTLTSTHTHQPDTPGLFGLCSCPETRTHEMSFFLRTHEHTRT